MEAGSPRRARIRHVRCSLGITQERFAAILGTSAVSLNRWEHGHAEPGPFYSTVFVLLGQALLECGKSEIVQRLEAIEERVKARLKPVAAGSQDAEGDRNAVFFSTPPSLDGGEDLDARELREARLEELMCVVVWLARPDGQPKSLRRISSVELRVVSVEQAPSEAPPLAWDKGRR